MKQYRFTRSGEYCIISISADEFATADILAYLPGARPVQAAPGNATDIVIGGDGVPYTIPYTAVDWAECDPIVNPATVTNRTTAMATITGQFVKDAAAGGGGGSVTVTNLPDDFPDGAVNTKLVTTNSLLGETLGAIDAGNAALGTAGTHETTNFPDSGLFGTAIRKLVYWLYQGQVSIQNTLNPMNVDTAAIKIASQSVDSKLSSGISVRNTDLAPVSVAGKAWTVGEVLGGVIDVSDACGVVYSFATAGNSGAGSLTAWYSQDNITWVPTYCYFWGPTSENATYNTAIAAANLNSSSNQVYIPAMARYVRLTAPSGAVTTGAFFTRKVAKVPLPVLRNVNPAAISLAASQTIGLATQGGNGFTISAIGTFNLLYGPTFTYSVVLFQFNKSTATALSATIEGSINGTDFVPLIDSLNLADFTQNEIAKAITNRPFYAFRVNVTAITGSIIYRGFRTTP